MRDNLRELNQKNQEEEAQKSDLLAQLMKKNLEFKVLSGIEIIVNLEKAL